MREFWNNLKLVWPYAKDHKGKLIKYALCNLISIIVGIAVPILSAQIIISLTTNAFEQLIGMAVILFSISMGSHLLMYFAKGYSRTIHRETFTKIQIALGKEVLKLETASLDSQGTGVFTQRLNGDASKIADIFNSLNFYLSKILSSIGVFLAVFFVNKIAFIYFVITALILYFVDKKRVEKNNAKDNEFRAKNDKISSFASEIIRGVRDIKMLNAEESFIQKFEEKVIDLNKTRYEMNDIVRNYDLVRNILVELTWLGLIFLLVLLIHKDLLVVANALVIYNYSSRVNSLGILVQTLMERVKEFNLSSSRVFELMDSAEFQKETFGTKHLKKIHGNFSFQKVSFRYGKEGNQVLKDVSFDIHANETVAFVGKSGAGKTTIFNLLCKMYCIEQGKITIDGINIQKLDKDTIRGNITIINQNPYIFNVSIRENFRLVKENLTEEEMIKACQDACFHDFIMSLPEQYDTIIGEGGVNLSGGQRQRLAIARAFIQKTEIILFDEATSALDNETQASIQQAINNMKGEYTILLIAHRLSTVIGADRILFLNEGTIEAEGTHMELLKKSKNYQNLYHSEQKNNFSKE